MKLDRVWVLASAALEIVAEIDEVFSLLPVAPDRLRGLVPDALVEVFAAFASRLEDVALGVATTILVSSIALPSQILHPLLN